MPSSRRKGVLTLHPKDGPEGTVLVESRTTDEPRPNGNDLSYYWVDPLENGMTRKTQMLSLMSEEPKVLGELLVLETVRSPKGFLYPTKLQHDSERESLRSMTYDFKDHRPPFVETGGRIFDQPRCLGEAIGDIPASFRSKHGRTRISTINRS